MRSTIAILLIMVLALSCRTVKQSSNRDSVSETITIIRDSIVTMPADSALIRAYFECDSLNNVVMRQLESQQGKSVSQEVQFKDQIIYVKALKVPENHKLTWKEKATNHTIIEYVDRVVEVKIYPRWLVVLALIGCIAIFVFGYKMARLK